jgi:hypothetical protein
MLNNDAPDYGIDPQALMSEIRRRMLAFLAQHKATCTQGENCGEAENMIAFLCHGLGVRGPGLLKVNVLLRDYDLACPGCDACKASRAAQTAGRGLSASNN